jgi:hypothetical protein
MIRSVIFLIIIYTMITVKGICQTIRFGFAGGFGISNVAKTNNVGVAFEQRNAVADYYAGLTATIKLNNDFSIKPELVFEKKGWTSKYNNLIINLTGNQSYFAIGDSVLNSDKVKLNYIKLPLNLSFILPQVIKGKISVELGPYFAYAISGNYTSFYGNTNTSRYNFVAHVNDDNSTSGIKFSRFDYGLNFKMGYELQFGLLVQAKYELGLHNVLTNELIAGPPETKLKSFLLGLSYIFN